MKRVISFMLVLTMAFALWSPVSAATVPNAQETNSLSPWILEESDSGDEYLLNPSSGEIIAKAFGYNAMGELVEIDLKDYLVLKNSLPHIESMESSTDPLTPSVTSSGVVATWIYDYRETRTYNGIGDPIKVSADMKGPGSISHFNATTIEHSFGGEVGLTWTMISDIQLGASFDWHKSLSSETSNGYTYEVPAGRTGYIQFTPYLSVTVGGMYHVYIAPLVTNEYYVGEVWGATPKEIAGGFADGLFELVLK